MSAPEKTVVHAPGAVVNDELTRVEAASVDAVLSALDDAVNPGELLVAVDDAFEGDTDALVALVSVLVTAGVQHIETAHVRAVARIFDTHLAISAGQIEVLES